MLRIHFSADDLVRIRIRSEPHPLWEVLLSAHLLQTGQDPLLFGAWRQWAREALEPSVEMLTKLARPKGYSPDFLTPAVDSADLEAGLESLLSTGRRELRANMVQLAHETAVPAWMSRIADSEASVMRQLAGSIRSYYERALRPHWKTIRAHIQEDHNRRAGLAADCGFESVLSTLHPAVKWRAPVLEVDYPVDKDLHLDGRGLVLTPSFFCWRNPITLADPDQQPTLVYPVERRLDWAMTRSCSAGEQVLSTQPESLAALLGRTRAAVLKTIADTPYLSTSELARATGISLAGASQHTTTLRGAGLVITHRASGSAAHVLSTRGACLLDGPARPVTAPIYSTVDRTVS